MIRKTEEYYEKVYVRSKKSRTKTKLTMKKTTIWFLFIPVFFNTTILDWITLSYKKSK